MYFYTRSTAIVTSNLHNHTFPITQHMLQHERLHLHDSLHSVHTHYYILTTQHHHTQQRYSRYLNISINQITTYLCSEFLCFNSLQKITNSRKLIHAQKYELLWINKPTHLHTNRVSTLSLISNLQTHHSFSNTAIQHLNF